MKICYIIVAHHQPNTFKKLISHLSTKHADIVVHIDRRVNEDLFRTPDNGGVHFMQDRRAVHWAGGSQTSTMCDALAYGLGVSTPIILFFWPEPISRSNRRIASSNI